MPLAQARVESPQQTPETCTLVDLASTVPHLPMRNARLQSTGWCFALAAADLLSIKTGVEVSGSALALAYYDHAPILGSDLKSTLRNYGHAWWSHHSLKTTSKEGGFPERVLETAVRDGFVCSEESFPTQWGDAGEASMKAYLSLLDGVEDAHEEIQELDEEEELDARDPETCEVRKKVEAATLLFPRLDLRDLIKVANRSIRETYLYELSRWGCDAIPLKKKNERYKVRHLDLAKYDDLYSSKTGLIGVRAIDQQLGKGNPVLIGYPGETLTDPEQALRTSRRLEEVEDTDADHASILIGRRWNPRANDGKGQCEYQLKNTWGDDCDTYHSSLECSRGIVWVGAELMGDMIDRVTWLE